MDFQLFKQIVLEASEYGARSFSLHLFGEPLLFPHWLEAIRFIKGQNRQHVVMLTTNGTSLNRCVDDVVASSLDLMLWSWRPEAKFTDETKRKLKEWGKFRVRFIKEVTSKKGTEEWASWGNTEERSLHNYGGEIELSKFGVSTAGGSQRYPCYHLWFAPAVAWNGDILLCCSDPHRKEVLGRFPEMSMSEAWSIMQSKRDEHLRGEYKGICKDCDVWKSYGDVFYSWQKGR